jgi:hypothetical protein
MEITELAAQMEKSFEKLEQSIPHSINNAVRIHGLECPFKDCLKNAVSQHALECAAPKALRLTWQKIVAGLGIASVLGGSGGEMARKVLDAIAGAGK